MRQLVINQIKEHLSYKDYGRYKPVIEHIFEKWMHVPTNTKATKKAMEAFDPETLDLLVFTTGATDEELISLYELVIWRKFQQR